MSSRQDARLETLIATVLRAGVLIALTIVAVGGLLYLIQHHAETETYSTFRGVRPDLRTIPGIWHNVNRLNGAGLIQFGLLVLIATPLSRVVMAAMAFASEGDTLYVVISVIVLAILGYSLIHAF